MSGPALRISRLSWRDVLRDVSLEVRPEEFVSILGPSGAGKTSVLRLIAGLERPDAGEIELGGRVVSSPGSGVFVPPQERDIGMVFQSFALWPHLTVFDNLAFPLRVRRWPETKIRHRVASIVNLLRLNGLERRYPSQLSGGQKQRVALGRSLAYSAKVILLDEPLANVDPRVREEIGTDLRRILKTAGATVLFVTHDQREALMLSDRIVLINDGRIVQEGTAQQLYFEPQPFTAEFFGDSNVIDGVYKSTSDGGLLLLAGASFRHTVSGFKDGDRVVAYVRYGDVLVVPAERAADTDGWAGQVEEVAFSWEGERAVIATDELRLVAKLERGLVRRGDPVFVSVRPGGLRVFRR